MNQKYGSQPQQQVISQQNSNSKYMLSTSLSTTTSSVGTSFQISSVKQKLITFSEYWLKKYQTNHSQIQMLQQNENSFHKHKDKLFQNLQKSLGGSNQSGIIDYLINKIWLSYIHQKLVLNYTLQTKSWLTDFAFDFNQVNKLVINILLRQYSKQLIQTNTLKIYQTIVDNLTNNPTDTKRIKINQLILQMISRNKNKVKLGNHITFEVFEISKQQVNNSTFTSQINLLQTIYSNPSIKLKIDSIKALMKMAYKNFSYQSIRRVLQYIMLSTGCHGFSQMFSYIIFMGVGKLNEQDKQFLQTLIIISNNLLSRDMTGFTNYKLQSQLNQNVLSRKSWKFIANHRSNFEFKSHVKVSHQQSSWQTLLSWNRLKPNCEITMAVNIKHNFLKVGIIKNVNQIEQCRDYSHSTDAVFYCIHSGILRKYGNDSSHKTFKNNAVNKITLKIVDSKISWIVDDDNDSILAASYQIDENQINHYKILIIFRKGDIQMFPFNN